MAGAVETDVARGPAGSEFRIARGQFADQLDQLPVVRVVSDLGAQHRGDIVRGAIPVVEELVRGGVEIDEAGVVGGRRGSASIGA